MNIQCPNISSEANIVFKKWSIASGGLHAMEVEILPQRDLGLFEVLNADLSWCLRCSPWVPMSNCRHPSNKKIIFFWLVCVCMWLYVYNPIKSILKQIITKHVVFQFGPIPSFYSHFWTPFLVSPSKSLRAPLGSQGNSLPTRWPRAGAAEDSSTPGRGSGSHWDSNPCWNSPEAESSELLVDWLGGWFKGTFWGNHGLSWSCPDQMEIGGGLSTLILQQSPRPLRPWAHPKTRKKQRAGASILTNAAPPTKLADANPSNCGHIHHKPGGFNPSEKSKSQLGWLFPTYGKIKKMFQTTNQSIIS